MTVARRPVTGAAVAAITVAAAAPAASANSVTNVYDEWDSHDEIRVAARGRGRLVGAGVHLTSGGF